MKTNDSMIVNCNGCEKELERFDSQEGPRLFKQQFVILCLECLERIQSGRWRLNV